MLPCPGQFADVAKRAQEHEEIAERERQERIAHAAGDMSKKDGGGGGGPPSP